jgi:3-oxoacyl-[acyl-carrier protein] reductase
MDLQLAGRIVFIAGASRGIGLGIAEACLAEGAKVALVARGAAALRETAERLAAQYGKDRVWTTSGDMRKTEDVEKAFGGCEAQFGPVWGAVANVGIHPCPPGFDVDDDNWDAGINQNLGSSFRVARAALRRMTPRGEGSILLISSIAGISAMGSALTYGTAKAAVNHLSGELAKLAGRSGIRVNTLAPGNIIFPDGDWDKRMKGSRSEAWQRWLDREVPLKRFGKPEEIGSVATFMLSPVASFLAGAMLPVDGAQSC